MKSFAIGSLILILLTVALFATSCGGGDSVAPSDSTAEAQTTTEVVTEAITEEPLPSVTLIDNGTSDYVVVCDLTDATVKRLVNDFVEKIRKDFGVSLPIKTPSQGPFEHEIIIGNVRDSAAPLAEDLNERTDFAVSLVEDDLVICASDSRFYTYAFSYVRYDLMQEGKDKTFSLTEADTIHYADSDLAAVSFLDYWKRHNYKIAGSSTSLKYLMEEIDVRLEDGSFMKSYVYIPFDYDPAKAYPVFFHFHGSDAVGSNAMHLGSLNGAFNVKDSPLLDAIVIAPQCPSGKRWVDTEWLPGIYSTDEIPMAIALKGVMSLLDEIEATYNTDKSRYYLRGYSMGGFATWDLLARYPGKFAAALPICGGVDPSKASAMLDVAIRTFHGELDSAVSVNGTRAVATAIEALGGTKLTYYELTGQEHPIWPDILNSSEQLLWMFAQQRATTAP